MEVMVVYDSRHAVSVGGLYTEFDESASVVRLSAHEARMW